MEEAVVVAAAEDTASEDAASEEAAAEGVIEIAADWVAEGRVSLTTAVALERSADVAAIVGGTREIDMSARFQ